MLSGGNETQRAHYLTYVIEQLIECHQSGDTKRAAFYEHLVTYMLTVLEVRADTKMLAAVVGCSELRVAQSLFELLVNAGAQPKGKLLHDLLHDRLEGEHHTSERAAFLKSMSMVVARSTTDDLDVVLRGKTLLQLCVLLQDKELLSFLIQQDPHADLHSPLKTALTQLKDSKNARGQYLESCLEFVEVLIEAGVDLSFDRGEPYVIPALIASGSLRVLKLVLSKPTINLSLGDPLHVTLKTDLKIQSISEKGFLKQAFGALCNAGEFNRATLLPVH